MASWSRREHVVTTVEFRIPANEPWGAPWNEVASVIEAAIREYRGLMDPDDAAYVPSDDSIRVHAEDDTIVISFVKNVKNEI